MNVRDIIIKILAEHKLKMTTLASRTGEPKQATWNKLKGSKSKTLSIPSAVQMLNAIDYKLVAMPITKHTPEDCYEITDEGK